MNRRKFLAGMTGLAGVAVGLYTWQVEPFWVEFSRQKMPVRHLPEHWQGKTLMQISDVHIGNRFDYGYIIGAFQKAQQLQPDLVAYTGDYVSYESRQQFDQLKKVLPHFPKGKLGTVGILGNHDYGHNWAQPEVAATITELLKKSNIKILRNNQADFNGLNIIGFDDFWATNFAPQQVMVNYNPDRANLVLCHNPDVCDLDVWNGYEGWILSGHTHGGQCKPPFLPPPVLPVKNKKYSAGLIDLKDGRNLYVNRAIGHLWQVRFNVRPEITIFELEKSG